MKPIKFKEHNVVFAENQDEYQSLPALRDSSQFGYVITCWKLTFWERFKILITGKMWSNVITFHHPLQPQFFTVNKSDVIERKPDDHE
ncbi:MAG: hypothetical protein ROO71_08870 [Balneola sp.]